MIKLAIARKKVRIANILVVETSFHFYHCIEYYEIILCVPYSVLKPHHLTQKNVFKHSTDVIK